MDNRVSPWEWRHIGTSSIPSFDPTTHRERFNAWWLRLVRNAGRTIPSGSTATLARAFTTFADVYVSPVSVIAVAQSLAICMIKLESQDAAVAVRTEK